jgi:hypothetical protein
MWLPLKMKLISLAISFLVFESPNRAAFHAYADRCGMLDTRYWMKTVGPWTRWPIGAILKSNPL